MKLAFGLLLLSLSLELCAYEPVTHSRMSGEALQRSTLATPAYLARFGLKATNTGDGNAKYPDSNGQARTIQELVEFGADWEDSRGALQATRHFYNPVDGSKLLPLIGETSPDWALEDRGLKDGQAYSYRLMRRNFFKALTEPAKVDRDIVWGLTFQTLGHLMHHIQDMAQPQHVRGDAHCDAPYPCLVPGALFGLHSPSIYEKRVLTNPVAFGNYPAVYSAADTATFNTPRKFWHTNPPGGQASGKGIAEFTNRNFISAGTNFDKPNLFPGPKLLALYREERPIAELCAEPGAGCTTLGLSGLVTFWGNRVDDSYTGETVINPRMTTLSVFDKYLEKAGKAQAFSYNRFNADAAAALLVPRAVGYSAGMINYFFRGEIDLVPDPINAGNVVLKNLGPEDMKGTFTLYYDAVDGNRYPVAGDAPGKTWTARTIAANGQLDNISFIPPANPAPEKTGEYMLVFNGDMGEEKAENGSFGAVAAVKIKTGGVLLITSLLPDQSGLRIHRSKDLGETWELGGPYFGSPNITAIGPETVLSSGALSTDSGMTWQGLPSTPYAQLLRSTAASRGGTNLLGTFLDGGALGEVKVAFSADNGANWSAGQTIPGLAYQVSQPTAMGSNRFVVKSFYLFGFSCFSYCEYSFAARLYTSADGGATWSAINEADAENMGKIIYLGKNRLVAGVLVPDKNGIDALIANRYVRLGSGNYRPEIVRSLDGGRTWEATGFPAEMAHYGEPYWNTLWYLVSAGNGTILAYFHNTAGNPYVPRHYFYKSTDNGATWALAGELPYGTVDPGLYGMAFVPGRSLGAEVSGQP